MSLMEVFEWIQGTPVGAAIRRSAVLIALVEGVHLVGLALLVGTILMVDLSLLGRGIRRLSTPEIARQLAGWTVAGLVIMLVSGPLMMSSEAVRCYKTPAFWVKMALLATALLYGGAGGDEAKRNRRATGVIISGVIIVAISGWLRYISANPVKLP